MLVPAILYKDEIINKVREYFYTNDMLYEVGGMDNWTPNIVDCPDKFHFQYAIVTPSADGQNKLIGYLSYVIDWYSDKAYNFGLFSFDRGNPIIGKEVFNKLEDLVNRFHRVEWWAVSGNPACKNYDSFIKRHNGSRHILKDSFKDRDGIYRDSIVYEIVKRRE